MANKPVWEQAFIAGYTQGYKVGWNRVEIAPSCLEENAESAYQQWWQETQKSGAPVIDCGTFSQK
jgi:hypothetical protein